MPKEVLFTMQVAACINDRHAQFSNGLNLHKPFLLHHIITLSLNDFLVLPYTLIHDNHSSKILSLASTTLNKLKHVPETRKYPKKYLPILGILG